MEPLSISVTVLTRNEEKNIEHCINSVIWANEIIVVDDYSQDSTRKIAQSLGAKVFRRHLGDDFSAQRNFGLSKVNSEWVLFVDADERVSDALASEIENLKLKISEACSFGIENSHNGFYIKRIDFIWGSQLRHGDIWHLRLAKKSAGLWISKVHEKWKVKGKVGNLRFPLYHYPHPTIHEFVEDLDFYTTLRAKELYDMRVKSSLLKIILFPKIKFLQNYLLNLGLLDGTAGFVHAVLMSFHSFLAWSKLWLMRKS